MLKRLGQIVFLFIIASNVVYAQGIKHKHHYFRRVHHYWRAMHRSLLGTTSNASVYLYSNSAVVYDVLSNKVLLSKNPDTIHSIASISKLMSAMVLLDSKNDMESYVTIQPEDEDSIKHTFSRLMPGMQMRRKDLLLLSLMSSENTATHALARTAYVGGIPTFISYMNKKCQILGMTHTQFHGPSGLDYKNQSTAMDLVKMVAAAYNYSDIRQDTTTKNADVMLYRNKEHMYLNSDAFVRSGALDIQLSKTGFINEAGHCLVLYVIVNKRPTIMVFLDSGPKNGRLSDALSVRNYLEHISIK